MDPFLEAPGIWPDFHDRLATTLSALLNRAVLRQGTWMDYTLFPVGLREPLPCVPVPLAGEDPDVALDLQFAAHRVFREGPYARAVDYTAEPDPPLSAEDSAWADRALRLARRR